MGNLSMKIKDLAVEPGTLALFWLGGANFVMKSASGRIVYVDPFLSDSLDHYYSWKRLPLSPIPFPPSEVRADLVLTTHAHEDHLDPESIPDIAQHSGALIGGPGMCVESMRKWGVAEDRIVELNRGDERTVAGIPVATVMAHHVTSAGADCADAVGYVVDMDGIVVYHTGDTLYHPELLAAKTRRPDVLLVCINGGYGNMNAQEAALLTKELEPAVVVPMHWGLVAENTADPGNFVKALAQTGSTARPLIMLPGDTYVSSFARI